MVSDINSFSLRKSRSLDFLSGFSDTAESLKEHVLFAEKMIYLNPPTGLLYKTQLPATKQHQEGILTAQQ